MHAKSQAVSPANTRGRFDDLLTTDQLRERLPMFNGGYWAKLRCRGDGPAFMRVGNRILYREQDVLGWLDARRAQSTTEAKRAHAA